VVVGLEFGFRGQRPRLQCRISGDGAAGLAFDFRGQRPPIQYRIFGAVVPGLPFGFRGQRPRLQCKDLTVAAANFFMDAPSGQ